MASGEARRALRGYGDAVPDRTPQSPAPTSGPAPATPESTVETILAWYTEHARDLPWRRPGIDAWAVLVSEFMLQQTPVARVRQPWAAWLERWPTPADLAAAPAGEAVRAWGRLGYPRRALRLHAAAQTITSRHGGRVPAEVAELIALPGVGTYTAAAVASFAYRRRAVVLDTNVRRLLTRLVFGDAQPGPAPTRAERALADRWAPGEGVRAARWAVASMELGALVCSARSPRCEDCPVADRCAWRRAGHPPASGLPRRGQTYAGTDRQCRGALLAVFRASDEPVPYAELARAWPQAPPQRDRALRSLVDDGLVVAAGPGWALPT